MKSLSGLFFKIFFMIVVSVKLKHVKSESTETFVPNTLTTSDFPETSVVQELPKSTKGSNTVSTSTKLTKTATEYSVKPWTVLEYVPITSFYHPRPVTLAQIIPPGTPWPDSPQTAKPTKKPTPQTTFPPNLVDRFPELTTLNKKPITATTKSSKKTPTTTVKPQTVLEYVPITSFHQPKPVTPAQIIPPGKPWPASPEGHQTESTSSTKVSTVQTSTVVNLDERLPDLASTTIKHTKIPHTTPIINTKPPVLGNKETTLSFASQTPSSTRIILTYKPQRPWYHPQPGNTINQVIPPGKPWPASPEGYSTFSVTTHPPWLKDVNEESEENPSLPHSKLDNLQLTKDDLSLVPNALQYYGPRITAPSKPVTPVTPYTSGTQKPTVADIVDIFKEVHNISLVSGNSPPKPSLLLPYDIDKGSSLKSPGQSRRNPARSQHNKQEKTAADVLVYDGTSKLDDAAKNDRIFKNPKFVPQ
ncbi:hypothetical protein ILUMI_22853 [Ignelater luminosus]|uniref:Uncharacterized protein n=1 Tax=Ignelater luminosus TaxID=2038154 RepID=A0A8K0G290_IGNLU|nr:hypothetical protein ILUMI_22853 [Ignelater luminosus]